MISCRTRVAARRAGKLFRVPRLPELVPVGVTMPARDQIGWEPKMTFEELVGMMVEADLELLSSGGHAEESFGDVW